MRENGFTLIELIIVVAVIVILATVGTGGLVDYTRTAKVNAAANELITTLNTAKSNALSQLKSALCSNTQVLNGYKVTINNTPASTYDLIVRCAGTDRLIIRKSLPANMAFSSTTPASFFFPVLTGGIVGNGTIIIAGYGQTRCAAVNSQGIISQSSACIPPTPTPTPTITPTPTPVPPPAAKTCTLTASTWRTAINAACASYCGAFTSTATCIGNNVTSVGRANVFNYTTCTSSSTTSKSGFVCLAGSGTTCSCN